jgi:hypothetical protein
MEFYKECQTGMWMGTTSAPVIEYGLVRKYVFYLPKIIRQFITPGDGWLVFLCVENVIIKVDRERLTHLHKLYRDVQGYGHNILEPVIIDEFWIKERIHEHKRDQRKRPSNSSVDSWVFTRLVSSI